MSKCLEHSQSLLFCWLRHGSQTVQSCKECTIAPTIARRRRRRRYISEMHINRYTYFPCCLFFIFCTLQNDTNTVGTCSAGKTTFAKQMMLHWAADFNHMQHERVVADWRTDP